MRRFLAFIAASILVTTTAHAVGKTKPKALPPKPVCERASYLGDPVCDAGPAHDSLPTPSSRLIRRHNDSSGFLVGDNVSLDGKTNFNENRYGDAPLHKFTPRPPSKASANGGAQIDLRF